ncbi:MAG: sulfite exporter TauE/SafE family protein [Phycisphaeraceae bacterium]|nr:sulfite exporter TauE/SafE family protein [Phycisphaeraceae bacterium]
MTLLTFTLILFVGSLAAGLLGSLTGLGGGGIIVPLLVLGMGVDLRYAIGASLVAIVATSSGAAAAYVREGYTNVRLGMLLEIATSSGAMAGALLSALIPGSAVALVFGLMLVYTAKSAMQNPPPANSDDLPDPLSSRLRLASTYPGDAAAGVVVGARGEGGVPYSVHRVPLGFLIMLLGGAISGLTGTGAGVVKVLAMDRVMRVPFKVSTTTSNFMIGVTAATGAGVYFARGQVDPRLCVPIILGVSAGSIIGARLLTRMKTRALRIIFAIIVAVIGVRMIIGALGGGF